MNKQKQNKKNNQNSNPFPAMEEEVLDFWDRAKTFEKSVNRKALKGDYVFYDGPPFGTGEPHYGHILSSVSKDVVPRYFTMRGYRVERRWGWDCHGLPIENIIEKEKKISGKKEIEKLGFDKFNEASRARVLEYADVWGKMVRRIGRWVDFINSYKTMDLDYMESVWWAFKQLWDKDLIYQGRKVLLYCPRCETPISNFEVAMDNSYKEITEASLYVKFKVKKDSAGSPEILHYAQNDNLYILAWTTTPWTLPGNVALAINKKIDYIILEKIEIIDKKVLKGEKIIIAKDDQAYWNTFGGKKYKINYDSTGKLFSYKTSVGDEYKILKVVKGKDLVGLEYEPLFDVPALKQSGKKVYYVAPADFVTTEDGTGVVHTAVVYGEEDYNLGLELDLPVIPAIDEKGYFNETVPQFKGMYFKKADKEVVKDLERRDLLFKKENYTHSYPFCHRCETQLFYNAIPAWFLNVKKLKKRMLELNKNISWFPEYLKEGRFALGIEQAPDWNISRNRYFATPMPIWQCDKCKAKEVIGSVAELEAKICKKNIKDIHSHNIDNLKWKCKECDGTMNRIPEVLDCWMESGSMPFAQMHYPFENKEKFEKNFPAQFISEYISQTRAWFYVMHVLSTALFDSNSFENVVTTGVIFNEKGEKMSKSRKNFPDPWKVINEFGVDALRFYLMSSSLMHAENLFFSERELRDIFRKNIMLVWNVYKFYEMYTVKPTPNPSKEGNRKEPKSKNILDKWIIAKLNQLIAETTKRMDNYDLPRATRPIEEFINDLSTWYLRRSRDRFKGEDEKDKEQALQTISFVLLQLSKVMAPFMPFIAEQLWQRVSGNDFKDEDKSVHLEKWPPYIKTKDEDIKKLHDKKNLNTKEQKQLDIFVDDYQILEKMGILKRLVEEGLSMRDEAGIKVRQPLQAIFIANFDNFKSSDTYNDFEQYKQLLIDELNVKEIISTKNNGGMCEAIKLDIKLTDELKEEGIKREIVRFINAMRKQVGMTIEDKAYIYWLTKDKFTKKAISENTQDIKKDTLASEMDEKKSDEIDLEKEVKVNGADVWLGVKRI